MRFISTILILFLVLTISPAVVQSATTSSTKKPVIVAAVKKTVKKTIKKKVKKKVVKKAVKRPTSKAATPTTSIEAKTVVNGVALTDVQKKALQETYKAPVAAGDFWYDGKSGAFGRMGSGMITFMNPGHNLGTLKIDASKGNTGVFINGRELPQNELAFYTALFGQFVPGNFWLEGSTGNFGVEGLEQPLANLAVALAQASGGGSGSSGGGDGNFYRSGITDTTVGSQGGCSYVSFGDGSSFSSAGC